MIRIVIGAQLAFLCLTIAGCAQPYGPAQHIARHGSEPSQAQRDAALQRSNDCMTIAAMRLDDRQSDAATVGRAVAALCREETNEWFRVRTYSATDAQRTAMERAWPSHMNELATQSVLASRNRRR